MSYVIKAVSVGTVLVGCLIALPALAEEQPPLGDFYSADHARKSSTEMRAEEGYEVEYRHIPPLSTDLEVERRDPYVRGRLGFDDDLEPDAGFEREPMGESYTSEIEEENE